MLYPIKQNYNDTCDRKEEKSFWKKINWKESKDKSGYYKINETKSEKVNLLDEIKKKRGIKPSLPTRSYRTLK